ncbi:DUF721 domain-containing protein [Flavipsychrobacter stenotrophus]|uniref:DUF721 domain-containing protein n=1 Tax=Flavipsychrobacter stenotrophus TaxID=2077091 RepID=A0A2S7SXE0_9BACT|nr:DUF721 domain-containing protein [Flavipsychrobacter stenotrophus]PQJ11404.1 DUF721 domain-containing protein [Flavipsychrobacter stenotrophus]
MGSYSVGEALKHLLEQSKWKSKIHELRLRDEWETIVGKTISKYTRNIDITNKVLTIYTDVAPLKQELQLGKEQLIQHINEYFEDRVVVEIQIK